MAGLVYLTFGVPYAEHHDRLTQLERGGAIPEDV